MMEAIIIFLLIAAFIALSVDYYKVYKEKEDYRCRVFDLTNGEEGSHLVKAPDIPPPPAPKDMLPSPSHPFMTEWLKSEDDIFKKSEVTAIFKNCGGKYVIVIKSGMAVNTDITNEDDIKWLLGINDIADIKDELMKRKLPECPERNITEDKMM